MLYQFKNYPFHTVSAHISNNNRYMFIDLDEGKKSVFGYYDLAKLGDNWFSKALPEPHWITKTDFSDSFGVFETIGDTAYAFTNIGLGESGRSVVSVDLKNPDPKNWK